MEYAAEGSIAPLVALRDGRYKLSLCETDPPMLFDLAADPHEAPNLAADPRPRRSPRPSQRRPIQTRWNLAAYDARCAKARPAAGWSMRRCATAPTTPGITSRCNRVGTLHAQPHGPERSGREQEISARGMTPRGQFQAACLKVSKASSSVIWPRNLPVVLASSSCSIALAKRTAGSS